MNNIESNNIESNITDYSVCMCGGGYRAFLFSTSFIENFSKKYHMEKIKYLSGTSGPTISFVLNHYDAVEPNDYYVPTECTIENMRKKKSNSIVDKFSNLVIADDLLNAKKTKNDLPFWIKTLKGIFFKDIDFKNNTKPNKPDYIMCCSIFFDTKSKEYHQLELTSNSCILPKQIVDPNGNYLYGGYQTNLDNFIKGIYMDSAVQCGMSTNFLEASLEYITPINTYEFELLNPITNTSNIVNIVDGGIYDNSGMISLLRRNIKNIQVNIYTENSIIHPKILNNKYNTNPFKFFEGNDTTNKFTIFKKETWDILYGQLLEKFHAGKPLIVNIKTEILENDFLGIKPYGEINFLFHLNSCNKDWFNLLPKETQFHIKTNYEHFPYFNFVKYKYDSITMNLVYSLFGWEIFNSKEYENFYSELNN